MPVITPTHTGRVSTSKHVTSTRSRFVEQYVYEIEITPLVVESGVLPSKTFQQDYIHSLSHMTSDVNVLRLIPVEIESDDGECHVARFRSAEIVVSGGTEREALQELESAVLATFLRYSNVPSSALGPIPTRQLAALNKHLEIVNLD